MVQVPKRLWFDSTKMLVLSNSRDSSAATKLPQQQKQMLLNYLRSVRCIVYHHQQNHKLTAGVMKALVIAGSVLILSGCSVFDSWVYRIDIPQGNYLEQRDVDQLR